MEKGSKKEYNIKVSDFIICLQWALFASEMIHWDIFNIKSGKWRTLLLMKHFFFNLAELLQEAVVTGIS